MRRMDKALRGLFAPRENQRFFIRDQSGAAAVEFALVAVPFFAIIALIFEQGLIMLADYSLQRGTERTARLMRIGTPPATLEAFREALCKDVFLLPNCSTTNQPEVKVRNAKTFAELDSVSLPTDYEPGMGGSAVEVTVTYNWQYLFLLPRFFDSESNVDAYRMTAVSVFRNEPF